MGFTFLRFPTGLVFGHFLILFIFSLEKFTIERKDIEFFEKIGSGQFGVVIKAEYKQRKVVAVKKMKPGSKEDEMNFNREAEFMMYVFFSTFKIHLFELKYL
jgi:hypothetical protein